MDDQARPSDVVQGVVRRITFHDPGTQYAVIRLEQRPNRPPLTVVGHWTPLPAPGEEIRVVGRWALHPTYGRQFEAEAYQPVTPATREGVERLLASGVIKGVGPATARRLVAAFGERALDVIASDPQRLASVPGIGPRKARWIAERLHLRKETQEALVFLHGLGLGPGLSRRILQRYGTQAPAAVRADPYALALEVDGIGFRRADDLAERFQIAPDSPRRVEAALWHVMREAGEEGHVYLPREVLFQRVRAVLGGGRGAGHAYPDEMLGAALGALVAGGQLVEEDGAVYPAAFHRYETELAGRLLELARQAYQPWLPARLEQELQAAQARLGTRLAPEQLQAVRRAMESGLLVVTGGPGTGKTTLVRFIVYLARRAGIRIALAAPTGRAAQRLQEAVRCGAPEEEPSVQASTVHRLLEVRPGSSSASRFARGPKNPIDAELVIVDEASMLDISLAYHLVAALGPESRLVLVGDVDQLPSVGPGQVLRDLIQSGVVPLVRLVHLFRQAARSRIVVGAHQILAGRSVVHAGPSRAQAAVRPASQERRAAAREEGSLRFFEEPDPQRVAWKVRELVTTSIPQQFGLRPVEEIQVLTASHRGPAGSDALNRLLQEALNPAGRGKAELQLGQRVVRQGDRVMQVRNDYQARLVPEDGSGPSRDGEGGEVGVFNGEIGTVWRVDPDERVVHVRFDDGRLIEYDEEKWHQLQLAYAITVHKSQGNEFPCVVMPVVWTMPALMTRHLLYTAVTRGRRLVVLVGDRKAVHAYVRNASVAQRYSMLARRLQRIA
ncbi:MAG: ATP-dependent RecD-like DNA helicase [Limnochordaceae bacterium]|nr:ATP-dependent RecD-like DNA helicase [Limnochordaceae bacterium]